MTKNHFLIIILCLGLLFIIGNSVLAYSWSDATGFYGQTADKMGLNKNISDPAQIVAAIINSLLLLVGAVFVIMVIYSGFTWMTAAGNEDKIKKAKQNLIYAVIGVIIISSAYSISLFVASAIEGTPADDDSTTAVNPCVDAGGQCTSSDTCLNDKGGTSLGVTSDCDPNICCLLPIGSGSGDCNTCGQGSNNVCDAAECNKLGNCVFYSSRCYNRGNCSECGKGRVNPCDVAECLAIGGCNFDEQTRACTK